MHDLTNDLDYIQNESIVVPQAFLESDDRDRLVWVAEAGLEVQSQSGFFLWSQGALQMLLPHEIMLCGIRLNPARGCALQFERFSSSRYFREEHFQAACDPTVGLLPQLLTLWSRTSRPCALQPGENDEMDRQLLSLELKNVIAHGLLSPDGEASAFFAFARTPLARDGRTMRILDLLTPIVYVTYVRVITNNLNGAGTRLPSVVSPREIEILVLIKEGRTTSHIAESLGLSPFTVKNHVQNILRKLGARTRSHAVAQAITMGLLTNW